MWLGPIRREAPYARSRPAAWQTGLETINESAEQRIANLHAIIKQLERARFGRSSEKIDTDQQAFAFEEVQTGLGAIEADSRWQGPAGERRRASRPRKAFPAHLERVEIVVEPEAVACGCGDCRPVPRQQKARCPES